MEWTLPVAPRPVQNLSSRQSLLPSKDDTPVASVAATSTTKVSKDSRENLLQLILYYDFFRPHLTSKFAIFFCSSILLHGNNYSFAEATVSEGSAGDISESFAFALVNGALGVFEVHGRRIRDFR